MHYCFYSIMTTKEESETINSGDAPLKAEAKSTVMVRNVGVDALSLVFLRFICSDWDSRRGGHLPWREFNELFFRHLSVKDQVLKSWYESVTKMPIRKHRRQSFRDAAKTDIDEALSDPRIGVYFQFADLVLESPTLREDALKRALILQRNTPSDKELIDPKPALSTQNLNATREDIKSMMLQTYMLLDSSVAIINDIKEALK